MLGKGHLRAPGGCGIVLNTVENVQLVSFLVVVVSVDYFRSAVVTVFFRPRVDLVLFTSLDTFGKLLETHVFFLRCSLENDRVCSLFQRNSLNIVQFLLTVTRFIAAFFRFCDGTSSTGFLNSLYLVCFGP